MPETRTLVKQLQNVNYSAVANPLSSLYQNSNGWVLSVISAAEGGGRTFQEAQNYYLSKNFHPSEIHASFDKNIKKSLDEVFGDWVESQVRLDDHDQLERVTGWLKFVSAASVFDFLRRTDHLKSEFEICHAQGCNRPLNLSN